MDTAKKIGRYEIIDELGHGAMGTVYRTNDPAMGRVVALKTITTVVLESEYGNESRERFYREARAAGALAHPGIVPVFDVGEHEGVPFLVMEFVIGRTLADVLKKGERLSIDRVCEIGQNVAEALGYAHQKGVVHRDIKPANILMTSREVYGFEHPRITDFGVAKLSEEGATRTGQIIGTPAFMPPEQFTGAPVDGRADIFSLGVVLYWMATGEQAFHGDSMTAVSYKVVHTEPVPPRKLNPSLPVQLENIILKCMSKSPEDRYKTGAQLALALKALLSGDTRVDTAISQKAVAAIDPEATLVVPPPPIQVVPPAETRQPAIVAPPVPKKRSSGLILAALAAVLAAAGGYILHTRRTSNPVPAQPSVVAPSVASAPPAAPPAQTAPPVAPSSTPALKTGLVPPAPSHTAKPSSLKVLPKPTTPDSSPKSQEPKSPEPKAVPKPAAIGFDPKSLDPKQNARLKINAEHFPSGVNFIVEMNGKLFYQKASAATKVEDEKLFVPPGVQEFRVIAKSDATEKTSNTVSTEFKAKKGHTLNIELRIEGVKGVPQGLYPGTQVVLSLK
jgi:eukaryotic-like serine/threonine-protein kinase